MTKTRISKKIVFLLAVTAIIGCMAVQVFAAIPLVSIWQPADPESPYEVHMNCNSNQVERLAWKTLSAVENPYFADFDDHVWTAKSYVGNDSANDLIYSYTFDGGEIDQTLVPTPQTKQPYYLYIETDGDDEETDVTMGCRTMFPVPMTVKVPTEINGTVNVEYVDGSCDGYIVHQATSWSQIMSGSGDPAYLNAYPSYVFGGCSTQVENGYVTFTTHHGGEYTITVDED